MNRKQIKFLIKLALAQKLDQQSVLSILCIWKLADFLKILFVKKEENAPAHILTHAWLALMQRFPFLLLEIVKKLVLYKYYYFFLMIKSIIKLIKRIRNEVMKVI